jgi:hypothetical protein
MRVNSAFVFSRPCPPQTQKVICFDASKREAFHPNSGYKKLFRRLRGGYKVTV